jgi:hypothetical protein
MGVPESNGGEKQTTKGHVSAWTCSIFEHERIHKLAFFFAKAHKLTMFPVRQIDDDVTTGTCTSKPIHPCVGTLSTLGPLKRKVRTEPRLMLSHIATDS